jgi:hypothetical protein
MSTLNWNWTGQWRSVTYVVDRSPIASPVRRAQRTIEGFIAADMLPGSGRYGVCFKCCLRRLCEAWIMVWYERLEVKRV